MVHRYVIYIHICICKSLNNLKKEKSSHGRMVTAFKVMRPLCMVHWMVDTGHEPFVQIGKW